jgi:hypothetical protein
MKNISFILFMLVCWVCGADIRYVNTDNTDVENGLTVSTGYYTIGRAFDGLDNTGYVDSLIIYCSGTTADTTRAYQVDSINWTSGNLPGWLIIEGNPTESDGAHPGYWSENHYKIENSASTYLIRNYKLDRLKFRRIQVHNTDNADTDTLAVSSTRFRVLVPEIIN